MNQIKLNARYLSASTTLGSFPIECSILSLFLSLSSTIIALHLSLTLSRVYKHARNQILYFCFHCFSSISTLCGIQIEKKEEEEDKEVNLLATQIRFESKTEIEVQYYDYGSI